MSGGGVVYEEVNVRKYRAASPWAHVFHAVVYITTLVLPLIIAFLNQGFWRKVEVYREQPAVDFSGKCILLIRGSTESEYAVWSSFHNLNEAVAANLNVPSIEISRNDANNDGLVDKISIFADFAHVPFAVHSVLWVFFVSYKLDQRFLVDMETAITGEIEQLRPGSRVHIAGNLNMIQKELLSSDFRQESPLNCSTNDIKQFEPINLVAHGLFQNFSTELASEKIIWQTAVAASDSFSVTLDIMVPSQLLYYKTGVFELLKWAWIQYLSLLVVVHFILRNFAATVFENHLLAVIS